MPLEKYEGFLELSVKELLMQSSPISLLDNMWCMKNQALM